MIKNRLVWTLAVLCFVASALLVVGRAQASTFGFSLNQDSGAMPIQVTVLDDSTQQPVTGAQVHLNDLSNDPFVACSNSESLDTTDDQGRWTAEYSLNSTAPGSHLLSVTKDGYAAFSLAGLQTGTVTVFLKPLPSSESQVVLSGEMGNWNLPDESSSTVHVGIVAPSLGANDLLDLTPGSLVSPLKDTVNVFGSRDIPSNLVLPKQRIPVLFTSIRLDKPVYRFPVTPARPVRMISLKAHADAGDLEGSYSGGKVSVDILNKITLTHVGMQQAAITPQGDMKVDLPADIPLDPLFHVTVSPPPFAADVVVMSIADSAGDFATLVPTDAKAAAQEDTPDQVNPVDLVGIKPGQGFVSGHVASIALANGGHRVSAILTAHASSDVHPGEFLPVDTIPDAASLPASIQIKAPSHGVGLAVFYADGSRGSTPVSYFYSLPSAGAVDFATQELAAGGKIKQYAVLQAEFDAGFNERKIDGATVMSTLQRFTRAYAKVGATLKSLKTPKARIKRKKPGYRFAD